MQVKRLYVHRWYGSAGDFVSHGCGVFGGASNIHQEQRPVLVVRQFGESIHTDAMELLTINQGIGNGNTIPSAGGGKTSSA